MQRAVCAGGIRGELGDGVAGCGIQPAQGDAGVLVGVDPLRGVGQEQGPPLVGVEQGAVRPFVGGDQAVQLAQLGDGAELFCKRHAAADFLHLVIGEGAGVELQPEAACQGYVKSEFE